MTGFESKRRVAKAKLNDDDDDDTQVYAEQRQQQAEPPPEWPLIKNILAVFGLDAIAFVAKWKAAQRPWVGLTEEDWEHIDNKKSTSLDTFVQGATWAEVQLRERNT